MSDFEVKFKNCDSGKNSFSKKLLEIKKSCLTAMQTFISECEVNNKVNEFEKTPFSPFDDEAFHAESLIFIEEERCGNFLFI
jgi:hypothetical protein